MKSRKYDDGAADKLVEMRLLGRAEPRGGAAATLNEL